MKRFDVDVDITMSCRIEVEAESEEQAKAIATNWIGDEPLHYVRQGNYVGHTVEAVNECVEEDTTLAKAIRYVRNNMTNADIDMLKAEMQQCYEAHIIPSTNTMDCDRVIDLLEEYGEDNDLPECWWESECDIDEILTKI